jgi:hypothetical protein
MPYTTPMENQNKGYAKQERKDLMNDMPIDKRASGGSFMSKHSQSKMGGSPLMDKGHGGAEFSENHLSSGKHKDEVKAVENGAKMSMSKNMTEKEKKKA